jgi:hypothetical protein
MLMNNLGEALKGEERDATRARDILRSLITQMKVPPSTPTDALTGVGLARFGWRSRAR